MNILVDNIGNASGSLVTPTQYVVRGSAKAWANLNGTGTIALRDSLNVSSVVDNGTGNYTFNTTSAFLSGENAGSATSETGTGTGGFNFVNDYPTTSSWQFVAYTQAGGFRDVSRAQTTVQGDLA